MSFCVHLNRWIYQVPALLVVFLFRLWLLNYWAGAFVFIYDVSVFLEHLETKSSSQKKRLAVYFPAAFSGETLRQLWAGRVREGRDRSWSRPPRMKHGCLKSPWHTLSLSGSARSSVRVQSLPVWSLNCFPWTHLHWFDKSCSVCRLAVQQKLCLWGWSETDHD